MLSETKIKEILGSQGREYSDEEIQMIVDFLYKLASIEYESIIYNQQQEANSETGAGRGKEPRP